VALDYGGRNISDRWSALGEGAWPGCSCRSSPSAYLAVLLMIMREFSYIYIENIMLCAVAAAKYTKLSEIMCTLGQADSDLPQRTAGGAAVIVIIISMTVHHHLHQLFGYCNFTVTCPDMHNANQFEAIGRQRGNSPPFISSEGQVKSQWRWQFVNKVATGSLIIESGVFKTSSYGD